MRGSIIDIVTLFGGLLAVIITMFSMYYVLSKVGLSGFDAEGLIDVGKNTMKVFDYLPLMLIIGTLLAIVVLSFFIKTHPVFFPLGILIFIFLVVMSPTVSNVYSNITDIAIFSGYEAIFPKTDFTMNNFPKIIALIGGLALIIVYSNATGFASSVFGGNDV